MNRSPKRFRTLAIVAGTLAAVALAVVGAFGYGWWKVQRIAEENFNSKTFANTAYELQAFVEAKGRWPKSEEEFIHWEGGAFGWFDRQQYASRTIIVYDVDLAREELDSPETFRLLKPRDPELYHEFGGGGDLERLLETLRAARDGELPIAENSDPSPAGQASPDDAPEESASDETAPGTSGD